MQCRRWLAYCLVGLTWLNLAGPLCAQDEDPPVAAAPVAAAVEAEPPAAEPEPAERHAAVEVDVIEMLKAGGVIGYVIIGLSIAMIALICEHWLTIRRGVLMPGNLAEEVHKLLTQGQVRQAEQLCKDRPSFLAYVLAAGLTETQFGYGAVEKSLEDASQQQAARLFRKIEYLSMISSIAPMLGLLGTVWGMILAFMEFEVKANPQVAELAPGIYHALVTTLMGLTVAIPSVAAFSYFRNRVDELVAQTSLMAEHVFSGYRRFLAVKQQQVRQRRENEPPGTEPTA